MKRERRVEATMEGRRLLESVTYWKNERKTIKEEKSTSEYMEKGRASKRDSHREE